MSGIEDWQAVTARNVASSVTKGYKAQRVSFEHKLQEAGGVKAGNQDLRQSVFPVMANRTSMVEGMMEHTGSPLDLAIKGQGFFEVRGPNGKNFYTRDGQFKVNAEGILVDKNGFQVQGRGGAITIDSAQGPFSVGRNGEISQGGVEVAQLRVIEPSNPKAFKPGDAGFYENEEMETDILELEGAEVLQGFVENSNVSPVREMVNLLTATRAYEANAKVVQAYDQHLEKSIQNLTSGMSR